MKLSKNFFSGEFDCKCKRTSCKKGYYPLAIVDLIKALQELRDIIACPIKIVSGYRCEAHNKKVGGAPESYHVKGMAVDIEIPKIGKEKLLEAVKKVKRIKGIGIYPTWIHLDIRAKKANW